MQIENFYQNIDIVRYLNQNPKLLEIDKQWIILELKEKVHEEKNLQMALPFLRYALFKIANEIEMEICCYLLEFSSIAVEIDKEVAEKNKELKRIRPIVDKLKKKLIEFSVELEPLNEENDPGERLRNTLKKQVEEVKSEIEETGNPEELRAIIDVDNWLLEKMKRASKFLSTLDSKVEELKNFENKDEISPAQQAELSQYRRIRSKQIEFRRTNVIELGDYHHLIGKYWNEGAKADDIKSFLEAGEEVSEDWDCGMSYFMSNRLYKEGAGKIEKFQRVISGGGTCNSGEWVKLRSFLKLSDSLFSGKNELLSSRKSYLLNLSLRVLELKNQYQSSLINDVKQLIYDYDLFSEGDGDRSLFELKNAFKNSWVRIFRLIVDYRLSQGGLNFSDPFENRFMNYGLFSSYLFDDKEKLENYIRSFDGFSLSSGNSQVEPIEVLRVTDLLKKWFDVGDIYDLSGDQLTLTKPSKTRRILKSKELLEGELEDNSFVIQFLNQYIHTLFEGFHGQEEEQSKDFMEQIFTLIKSLIAEKITKKDFFNCIITLNHQFGSKLSQENIENICRATGVFLFYFARNREVLQILNCRISDEMIQKSYLPEEKASSLRILNDLLLRKIMNDAQSNPVLLPEMLDGRSDQVSFGEIENEIQEVNRIDSNLFIQYPQYSPTEDYFHEKYRSEAILELRNELGIKEFSFFDIKKVRMDLNRFNSQIKQKKWDVLIQNKNELLEMIMMFIMNTDDQKILKVFSRLVLVTAQRKINSLDTYEYEKELLYIYMYLYDQYFEQEINILLHSDAMASSMRPSIGKKSVQMGVSINPDEKRKSVLNLFLSKLDTPEKWLEIVSVFRLRCAIGLKSFVGVNHRFQNNIADKKIIVESREFLLNQVRDYFYVLNYMKVNQILEDSPYSSRVSQYNALLDKKKSAAALFTNITEGMKKQEKNMKRHVQKLVDEFVLDFSRSVLNSSEGSLDHYFHTLSGSDFINKKSELICIELNEKILDLSEKIQSVFHWNFEDSSRKTVISHQARENLNTLKTLWEQIESCQKNNKNEDLEKCFSSMYSFYIYVISDMVIHGTKMKRTMGYKYSPNCFILLTPGSSKAGYVSFESKSERIEALNELKIKDRRDYLTGSSTFQGGYIKLPLLLAPNDSLKKNIRSTLAEYRIDSDMLTADAMGKGMLYLEFSKGKFWAGKLELKFRNPDCFYKLLRRYYSISEVDTNNHPNIFSQNQLEISNSVGKPVLFIENKRDNIIRLCNFFYSIFEPELVAGSDFVTKISYGEANIEPYFKSRKEHIYKLEFTEKIVGK